MLENILENILNNFIPLNQSHIMSIVIQLFKHHALRDPLQD